MQEVEKALERIRSQMKGFWVEDQSLFDNAFPTRSHFALLRYNPSRKRWKNMPERPRELRPFITSLQYLLNGILMDNEIDYTDCRVLYTGAAHKLKAKEPALLPPALFMFGAGKQFCNTSIRANADIELGICPIQVILDSADSDISRERLTLQVEHMLRHQPQRRFAFGLVMTPHLCRAYYFDRAGSVSSHSFSYHAEPRRFCALLAGLAGSDASRVGFDPTVYNDGKNVKILCKNVSGRKAVKHEEYVVKDVKHHSPELVCKGTSCWLVTGPDGANYIVRDKWTILPDVSGRESEKSLLDYAYSQGVNDGIVQLRHYEELSCSGRTKDTIYHNRRIRTGEKRENLVNRMHIRSVSVPQGKHLHEFSTREELLIAFHDAVLAHRQLYCVAGILHRDISHSNILIDAGASEGNRGILIDFNQAIRINNTPPYSKCESMGTYRYMSRNVLSKESNHTYFDDLESFFWVLAWIVSRYSEPGKLKVINKPDSVSRWDSKGYHALAVKKACLGIDWMDLRVESWFGPVFHQLLSGLHQFFHHRTGYRDVPPAPLDSEGDYTEYLDLIKRAVDGLSAI